MQIAMCWLNVAIHSESLTQIVGDFLKDLDIYFDLKVAPEKKTEVAFCRPRDSRSTRQGMVECRESHVRSL